MSKLSTIVRHISIVLVVLVASSCFDPPDFSDVPSISFEKLTFIDYEVESQIVRDSMLLWFNFKDGDGDVGLDKDALGFPYHQFNVVIDSNDSLVTLNGSGYVLPFFTATPNPNEPPKLFSEVDNRPDFNTCDYFITSSDTFFIQENEFNSNFHIDFLSRKNGVYRKVLFSGRACDNVDFNARIPVFDEENTGKSISGTIRYFLSSQGFPITLTPDTFKIRFYIYDRALNKSNVVESPEFLFQDIVKNR